MQLSLMVSVLFNSRKATSKRKVEGQQVLVEELQQPAAVVNPPAQAAGIQATTGDVQPLRGGYNFWSKKPQHKTEQRWVEPVQNMKAGDPVREDSGHTYKWVLLVYLEQTLNLKCEICRSQCVTGFLHNFRPCYIHPVQCKRFGDLERKEIEHSE